MLYTRSNRRLNGRNPPDIRRVCLSQSSDTYNRWDTTYIDPYQSQERKCRVNTDSISANPALTQTNRPAKEVRTTNPQDSNSRRDTMPSPTHWRYRPDSNCLQ